jgi:hypothetical protein
VRAIGRPLIVVFALYAVATAVLGFLHEPWRDEADSWLIVRDESLTGIAGMLRYAGTPGLWYLLTAPLAKLGLPYGSQFVLHWAIALAGAGVILFRLPFPPWVRVLLVVNGLIAFEYAVVARSYALTILFIALFVSLHPERAARPRAYGAVLLLLANTNVMGLFITCGALAASAMDIAVGPRRREALVSSAIGALGVVLAVVSLWPPADGPHGMFPERFFSATAGGLVPYWGVTPTAMAFGAACLAATLVAVRRSAAATTFYLTTCALFFYLFAFKHIGDVRHHAFICITMWIAHGLAGPRLAPTASYFSVVPLAACLLLWTARGAEAYQLEATRPYSCAQEAGRWLQKKKLKKLQLVGHPNTVASAVLPWLPGKRPWYPQTGQYGTHMEWNENYVRTMSVGLDQSMQRVAETLKDWQDPKKGVVLLSGRAWHGAEKAGFVLVFQTKGDPFRARDEKYWIYAPKGSRLAPKVP